MLAAKIVNLAAKLESSLSRSSSGLSSIHRFYSSSSSGNYTTISADDVKKFLEEKKIASEHGFTCLSFVCPSVPKTKSSSKTVDDNNRIFVNDHTGAFVCNYCLNNGDYAAFQNLINSIAHGKGKQCLKTASKLEENEESENNEKDLFVGTKCVAQLSEEEFTTLRQKLRFDKKLLQSTFAAFDCYASADLDSIIFPYHGPASNANQRLRGVRTVSSQSPDAPLTYSRMKQKGPRALYGLFGWNLLSKRTTEVIVTANEFDAMAVYQSISHSPSSSLAVLSLPCGTQTLPQYVLPLLEPFKKISLWLGSEMLTWQAAKQFSRKLGEKRCHLVRPNDQWASPHDALAKGADMKEVIANAHPAAHKAIVSFSQLKQDVFAELSQSEQVAGIRWKKFPKLNELLKGHRRGELTIFTGPTGAGKTTFISDYSLDLATQGVATLWGSFEISNVRLCKLMLTQFAGRKLLPSAQLKSDFCSLSEQFEQLPIHFLTFHGSESLKRVIDAMQHAVYVHDIVHVVIDNLQFMTEIDSDRNMIDRFQKQDQIIAALRRFATQQNCHVTLVIHPRKEADGQPLTNSSIFGGVKAVQEADNVMILQPNTNPSPPAFTNGGGDYNNNGFPSFRNNNFAQHSTGVNPNTKIVQITKNRFDGELGKLQLRFNRDSLTFEQIGGNKPATLQQNSVGGNKFFTPQTAQRTPSFFPPPQPKQPVIAVADEHTEDAEETESASASVDALLSDLGTRSTQSN